MTLFRCCDRGSVLEVNGRVQTKVERDSAQKRQGQNWGENSSGKNFASETTPQSVLGGRRKGGENSCWFSMGTIEGVPAPDPLLNVG